MSVKIKNGLSLDIHVSELKDGELAIITNWTNRECISSIVQKYKDSLIHLGENSYMSWTNISAITKECRPECTVQVLPKGTLIEVV